MIWQRVHAEPTPPRLVVLDLSAAPRVDLQSAHALADLAAEIVAKGIRFQAVEPRSSVRDRLRNEGVDSKLGGVNRFTAVADVVENRETQWTYSILSPREGARESSMAENQRQIHNLRRNIPTFDLRRGR